jgi:hypothetical protein
MKKAGWKFKASSDGTTKISSADPAADQWGAGTISNTGAAAASIAAPTQGRATVTGLANIVATDKGKFLLISGAATGANNNQHQIEEILSSSSVRIDARNFAVATDANNGTLTWSIRDPTGNNFVNTSFNPNTIAWWCAQGPSILKIPITTASTGNFIRGENVVQSTTLAEGEILGYTYYNATGWLVIAPRVRGSGGGVYGWATGEMVTGGRSGATVSQSGTALDYVYEVVFAKPANQTNIQILLGQFNTVADSAEMFSFCATQSGCTATVHPGGGGTGNAFGAHAWVAWGTNSTPTFSLLISDSQFGGQSVMDMVNANVLCVDAIPEQSYTADGSWSLFIIGNNTIGGVVPTLGGLLYGFHRLNDTEDGEVSPYVSVVPAALKTLYGNARTSSGTNPFGFVTNIHQHSGLSFYCIDTVITTTAVMFAGWRGRGLANEAFTELEIAALNSLQTGGVHALPSARNRAVSVADQAMKSRVRIWLCAYQNNPYPLVKGTFRWLYWVSGDHVTDAYGTDPGWVQLATGVPGTNPGAAMIIGPYDGTPWYIEAGPN